MIIRYMSDIHLEFGWMDIMSLREDKDSILVLAGDIGVIHTEEQFELLGRFLSEASSAFRGVIYVLGNHEFYKMSLFNAREKIREKVVELKLENVYVLENEVKVIDNVAFIGATLWTDYDNHPVNRVLAKQAMNDFYLIHFGNKWDPYQRFMRPEDLEAIHHVSRRYVFDAVKEQKAAGNKTVVVVHHGVTYQSVAERFRGDPYNSSFVSDLSNDILESSPDVIIHGHVHDAFDYMVGDTRVVVNPRGYVRYESGLDFDPIAMLEI